MPGTDYGRQRSTTAQRLLRDNPVLVARYTPSMASKTMELKLQVNARWIETRKEEHYNNKQT